MAIYGYTKNYKLIKPQFDTDTWHDYIYDNLDTIDAIMSAIYSSGNWQGFWQKNTHYDVGDVIIDQDTDTMYKVLVEHTTSENTFALEQAAHPTYYELWSPNNLAESWAIDMDGPVSSVDYSSKAYAISSGLIDAGSAKEWAIGSGEVGDTGEYSAKKYATDAHDDYISMTTDPNVVAVGTNIASVNTVSTSISEVNTTASNIASVNTVAGDINRVNLVADDISSVHTVAIDISNVIDVAANKTNIDTVAGISTDVTTVASIANAVSNVSGIESEVLDVSDNRTDISTVASNIGDVNTVADISTDVSTVADNDANVTTVATNISDVNIAATNIAAIQAAPTQASNAAASATLAQEWASKMDGQVASTDYSSKYYAGQSATSADNSHVWAEGTDEQVQALGGVHSSKVWAEQSTNANIALTNSPYTTNRILEIPQDIKLELNNGTLTLKAGSKVYVPNGFKSDGVTPKFDVVTTAENKSLSGVQNFHSLVFHNPYDFSDWPRVHPSSCFSGTTAPSGYATMAWYDTSNNIMKITIDGGSTWKSGFSLPYVEITETTTGVSIDQIFNGFGDIGSTTFALPGVKVLQATGFDGNMPKSEIQTIPDVIVTQSAGNNAFYDVYMRYTDSGLFTRDLGHLSFDADKNLVIDDDYPSKARGIVLYHYSTDSTGKIKTFNPTSIDFVANSNASNFSQAGRSYLSGLGNPSTEGINLITTGAINAAVTTTAQTYIAPASGVIQITGSDANYTLLICNNLITRCGSGAGSVIYAHANVSKGDTVYIKTDIGTATLIGATFRYANGEV